MSQVFEFHFNPPLRPAFDKSSTGKQGFGGQAPPDLIFDSFCFEPENFYERKVGSLYVVGLLKNALPQNARLLDDLVKTIKGKHYRLDSQSPEKSLKEGLKEANNFLESVAKRGDVSWLGNLSFAVFSLKNYELNFTKVGQIKIYILRDGQIIDVEKGLKFSDIEPYPLKIFGNIVSGKLSENDVVLVLTKEVSDFFNSQNLLPQIAKISPFDEKKLKEIFKEEGDALSKIPGICFLMLANNSVGTSQKETVSKEPRPRTFYLKEIFRPMTNLPGKIYSHFLALIEKTKIIKAPKIKIPAVKITALKFKLSKKLIPAALLIVILLFGYFLSLADRTQKTKSARETFSQIKEKVSKAESFLIVKNGDTELENRANSLLKEGYEDILELNKIPMDFSADFRNEVSLFQEKILKELLGLNKSTEIENPELLFEFSARGFIPQKMVYSQGNLYFFTPYGNNLFEINDKKETRIIETDKNFNLAAALDDSLLLFTKPDKITYFKNGQLGKEIILASPGQDYDYNQLSLFKSNLYFLNQKQGQIIKYSYLGNSNWGSPESWLEKKATGLESVAVDGSVWILNADNSIGRYYFGKVQETLKLEFFPASRDFSKIFISPLLPYIYILEPVQKRIVIINKSGKIFKQLQSQKFDNLLDFSVSEDGKTIWLLNGLKVYKIEI